VMNSDASVTSTNVWPETGSGTAAVRSRNPSNPVFGSRYSGSTNWSELFAGSIENRRVPSRPSVGVAVGVGVLVGVKLRVGLAVAVGVRVGV